MSGQITTSCPSQRRSTPSSTTRSFDCLWPLPEGILEKMPLEGLEKPSRSRSHSGISQGVPWEGLEKPSRQVWKSLQSRNSCP